MNNFSFNDILNQSINNLKVGGYLSTADILLAFSMSLLTSLMVFVIYEKTYAGVLYQKSFAKSLVLLSMITTMVIMTISGNLILSLGMVGALSVIRFRTAVKEPLDIIFMFWSIALGLANGVAFFKLSILGTILIGLVAYVMNKMRISHPPYVLILDLDLKYEKDLIGILKNHTKSYQIKTRTVNDSRAEITAEIRLADQGENISKEIINLSSKITFTLVSYDSDLDS